MPAPQVHLTLLQRSDCEAVIQAHGELDLTTSGQLRSALEAAVRLSSRVRVDLTDVTFVDGATLGLLEEGSRSCRAAGGALQVTGASGHQRRVFRLGRLEHLLAAPSERGNQHSHGTS